MKLIIGLLLVLGLSGCIHNYKDMTNRQEMEKDRLIERIGGVTIALVHQTEEHGIQPYCGGVWVSTKEILTAHHCLEDEGENLHYIIREEVQGINMEPSAIHLAHVKRIDEKHDLAILEAVESGIPVHKIAKIRKEELRIGERVYIMGHPVIYYWSYSEGIVSAQRKEITGGPYVQINGSVFFGNSGGAAFDREGKVVGISSKLLKVPGMSLFIPVSSINRLLP